MKSVLRHSAILIFLPLLLISASAQSPDNASVVQHIDAAVHSRFEHVSGYTVTEHYRVFRNHDETTPAAEMTVKTLYQKDEGKSYTVLSESGSMLLRKYVLDSLLENEKRINSPGVRETAWFTTDNYELKLKSNQTERIDGRDCLVVEMNPRRKASNMLIGTMWVDAADYTTVQIHGISSKDPSIFSGAMEMTRLYAKFSGYAQATHARAVSNSPIIGQTVVTIDYQDYQVQIQH